LEEKNLKNLGKNFAHMAALCELDIGLLVNYKLREGAFASVKAVF
jgi:hypothetical protein